MSNVLLALKEPLYGQNVLFWSKSLLGTGIKS
jgi:hypothetical protein